MKTRLLSLTPLLLTGLALRGQSVNPDHVDRVPNPASVAYKQEIGRDPSTWQWNIPLELPRVTHGVVRSAAMDRDIGFNIYLPPSYASAPHTRYPVVYYFHGATGSETSDIPVTEYVAAQIEKGNIGEVIYVLPNAGHFSGYRDRATGNVRVETYLIHEFIPEIDRRYRTIASREGRALMGFSMGGGGATRLGLKYPDMFSAVVSFGGALGANPARRAENAETAADPDNVYHWATLNQTRIRDRIGLYFIVGGTDRMYAHHAPFLEHLHGLEINFHYRVLAGVGHDIWRSMDQCGGDAIRFVSAQLAASTSDQMTTR
ncbi:alpha/beta hydrolase [Synoicihabitans lomoniglobus]|uniref:Alpha/beta hydrolase-fold protein n=1 Tax=Synoicihabitans lomoniglobus TaxID=2909285 RepID=A0AAF0CQ30_9BACT|nr:esterase family protein [Opitutaceae bacterium LMO-M01]WED65957.1 alpha/beta hydrolase-fold protein [Opitutaceae bacterium LMO-M01]